MIQHPGLEPRLRTECVVSLSAIRQPTVAVEVALQQICRERAFETIGLNALLTLGIVAKRARALDGGRADAILGFMLGREPVFAARGETRVFLQALANTGSAQGFTVLRRYSQDADDELRATAVAAMAWVPESGVAAVLREVSQQSLTASEADLRRAAIVLLGQHVSREQCQQALLRVRSNDPDQELRQLAAELLGS